MMPPHTQQVQTVSLIMPHGGDDAAAAALAQACNMPLHSYDLTTLTAALTRGQRCVVVWSDPRHAIAAALRAHHAPSTMAAAWCQSSQDLLRLFTRNRRLLLLVAADLIHRGTPQDFAHLADRLPLVTPMRQPLTADPQGDLHSLLARLICAQYTDLRQPWDELLISSLSLPDDGLTATDVDALEHLLARQQAEMTQLQTQIDTTAQQHLTEMALLRDVVQDLSQTLTATAQGPTPSTTRPATTHPSTDAERVQQLNLEVRLLRDQMAELTNTKAQQTGDVDRHVGHSAPMAAPHHQSRAEIALLREQLASVTALLQSDPTTAPDSAKPLGPAHRQIESAFAKLLSALVTETDLRLQAQDVAARPKRKSSATRSAPRPGP